MDGEVRPETDRASATKTDVRRANHVQDRGTPTIKYAELIVSMDRPADRAKVAVGLAA